MSDYPTTLIEFQTCFPDNESCEAYLIAQRWSDGFSCPKCGHDEAYEFTRPERIFECRKCHHQASVKSGTLMHGSKLPLTIWFWAAWLMATHSNGISAKQLQRQLGLGSYKSAWLLCAKLRRAMVDPHRNPLNGLVEVDESSVPHRTRDDPPDGGQGRSGEGKLLFAGAVEVDDEGRPGRIRLSKIDDHSAESLHDFIKRNIAAGSTAKTDGWSAYPGAPDVVHDPHVVGPMAAHVVLPWIHRVFSNLKTLALGVYHGLREDHFQSYLDEFTFRFNRRRNRPSAFRSLLQIATRIKPITYNMLMASETEG